MAAAAAPAVAAAAASDVARAARLARRRASAAAPAVAPAAEPAAEPAAAAEALPAPSLPDEPVEPLPPFDAEARSKDAEAAANVVGTEYAPLFPHVTEMLGPLRGSVLEHLTSPGQLPPPDMGSLDSFLPATYKISVLSRIKPPTNTNAEGLPTGLSGLANLGMEFEFHPDYVQLSPPSSALAAAGAPASSGTAAAIWDKHKRISRRSALVRVGPPVDLRVSTRPSKPPTITDSNLIRVQPSGDISLRPDLPAHGTPAKGAPAKGKRGGRRTRRRTQSFLPYRRHRTHHAIKMSSRRHSVSGRASSRRLTSSKVLSSGSSSGPSGRRVSSTRMSTKPVPQGGF